MADQFPCPNPTCSHLFTLAALQAAESIKCPRCGFQMKGHGPAATPAKPKPKSTPLPGKKFPAKPPKVLPARPVTAPPQIDVDLVDVPPPPAIATRPVLTVPTQPVLDLGGPSTPVRRRSSGLRSAIRIVVVLGVIALSCGLLAVAGYFIVINLPTDNGSRGGETRLGDYDVFIGRARNLRNTDEPAFRLLLTKKAWTPEKQLKDHLGALGAWMNKQDDIWGAVAVKDYGLTKPRDAELVELAVERLERHFGDTLELAAKTEPIDFLGPPARKLAFKGRVGSVVWFGECIMFSHHGLGYWIFLAGPGDNELPPFVEMLRKEDSGLSLVDERRGWREQPPRLETFASSDGNLSLTTPEGVWEKAPDPKVEYETGTLLLVGRYLKEKDNRKNAHLQVLKLESKPGDLKAAVQEARNYLEKVKKDQNAGYKLGPIDAAGKSEWGEVEDIGNRRGRVAELMLSLNDAPTRYYLVAVIGDADRTTVVLCDCLWKSRQIWRQDFLELLKSAKVQKGG